MYNIIYNMDHMNHNNNNSNPCKDDLTNLEYLEHMIPHHQVAIDMSVLLIEKTKDMKYGRWNR